VARGSIVVAGAVVVALAVAPLAGPLLVHQAHAQVPPPEDGEDEPAKSASAAPPARIAAPEAPPPHVVVPFRDGMLELPGGRFTMGSGDPHAPPNERPPRAVTVPPFRIDKLEVTVGAYRACVDSHTCARPQRSSASCTFDLRDVDLPVSCVRWLDADTYCRSVGRRLPREAEWEFAARGTATVRYPWGHDTTCAMAATLYNESTSRSCSGKTPATVGAHPRGASVFGVLDLTGNVEEWTADFYTESPAAAVAPRAGSSHVLRGGGWLSTPLASCLTARNWGSSLEAGPNVGFRCAKDVKP
jgi:formylglycine-generating enzyme required for sulfatase activity